MATIQTNGSAVTSTSTKNNGGAVIANSQSSIIESRPFVQPSVGVFGSIVVNGVNTNKSISIGVFGYSSSRPVGMKVTGNIAATLNNFLLSGANDPGSLKSINNLLVDNISGNAEDGPFIDGVRTTLNLTAYRQNKFNIITGKYESGYPAVSKDYFLGVDNASGDKAAKPTRLIPGALVYKIAKTSPVNKNYSEKTG